MSIAYAAHDLRRTVRMVENTFFVVILPAVLRRPLPYHPLLWVPFALLHASLVVRLWLGGALLLPGAWRAGGVTNVLAVLLFVGVAAWRVLSARSRADRRTP